MLSIILIISSLTGCASDNASNAKLQQAIAAKAYNDFSACYGITDLESDTTTANTANNNADNASYNANTANSNSNSNTDNAAYTASTVSNNSVVNARFHAIHHSYRGRPHSYSHSLNTHENAGNTESKNSSDNYQHSLSDKVINRANENRSKSELLDGTNHDSLITDNGTRKWYSNHNYYIPGIYANHANTASSNADKNKDNVAYFFLKYILDDNTDNNDDTSLNVNWKYDDTINTGSITLFTSNNVKYAKLQANNSSDKNNYNTACTAVNLPLPNNVSKSIGKYNE